MRTLTLLCALLLASVTYAKPPKGLVTVYGSTTCPSGFTALYTGSVIYLNLGRFDAIGDGLCWKEIPPAPPSPDPSDPFAAYVFTVIGVCVVCGR